jgi:hypothetical protein
MDGDTKADLLKWYEKESPDAIQIEDDDGSSYPKKISVPAIAYIPPAEPHVLITDLYENPQDWYDIHQLIEEFADQSFAAYYNGLYFASYTLSTSCLELTLKYEILRNGILDPSELEKSYFTFAKAIDYIDKLGLSKYKERLEIVNQLRSGIFHYNPRKLRRSLISVRKELYSLSTAKKSLPAIIGSLDGSSIDDFDENDSLPNLSYLMNNKEWSKTAFFTYKLMHDITKKLYGRANVVKYLKEGQEDYRKRKNMHS